MGNESAILTSMEGNGVPGCGRARMDRGWKMRNDREKTSAETGLEQKLELELEEWVYNLY